MKGRFRPEQVCAAVRRYDGRRPGRVARVAEARSRAVTLTVFNTTGLWCMTNDTDPIGFPCPTGDCHWIYDELQAWKAAAKSYSDE